MIVESPQISSTSLVAPLFPSYLPQPQPPIQFHKIPKVWHQK